MEIACSTIYWTGSAQSNDYIWYISQDGGHLVLIQVQTEALDQ